MRMMCVFLILFLETPLLRAQSNGNLFSPLDLPTANDVRTADGRPGPGYWQQRADYSIKVDLDTSESKISGSETITYTNNSPQSLDHLWLQLDQNLFKEGSRGSYEFTGRRSRYRGAFENGGYELSSVIVVQDGKKVRSHYIVDDTRMRVDIERPVPARGGKVQLEITWSFAVPRYGSDRLGRFESQDGTIYEIAQWYPRMCVYDDVNGWNPLPYLGEGEFYLEYGNFDVEITVPHDYIVMATGVLQNPEQVLTRSERDRLALARKIDSTIHVISKDEIAQQGTRPEGKVDLTWRYHAENVRDFSWAASHAFIWDASHWDNILLMAVYPKEGISADTSRVPGWEKDVEFMRHTFKFYSETYYHFPYPVATNVAGIVGGMEYPMIVFCNVRSRGQGLYSVTDHEFGHGWFPMTVGSDERRYAWMDEGINTFINYYSGVDYYGGEAIALRTGNADTIARRMCTPVNDQPIMTRADQIKPDKYGFLEYYKTAFGLRLLREQIIGPERFDRGFKNYIQRWAFKHPQPSDFFRTISDYSGEDLDWFWKGWFYSTDVLDQAVDTVVADSAVSFVYLSNKAGLVMPFKLQVTFDDGSIDSFNVPVEAWFLGNDYTLQIYDERKIDKVVVDPGHVMPDVNRDNNIWERKNAATGN
ncbi:MAG TPA: M1 family metallopeptidase [Candidatus Acidoferrales bacterium]|nr:M1 family metallopeptidase [Candidatus Acidoferrales bacterium]